MDKIEETDYKAKIFYYFREKYFNQMLNTCKEAIGKYKSDVSLHLYHALALVSINRLEEGIHELEGITFENEVKLASTIALIYGNKLIGGSKELFIKLDNQMREYRKTSDSIGFYHSAFVLITYNKLEKALDYIEKSINLDSNHYEAQDLKGWILLQLRQSGQKTTLNAKNIFQKSLEGNPRSLNAILGLTECYIYQNDFKEALNIINRAVVRYTTTNLPLIQKMRILFAQQDWDQTIETMIRVQNTSTHTLEALKLNITILLCRDANYPEAIDCIKNYFEELDKIEPNNTLIILETSQLFSRICGRNTDILNLIKKMLDTLAQTNSDNPEFIIELGYQSLLRVSRKEALRYFKMATKLDETSLKALLGLTVCEYNENGKTDQLKKQIEFLQEFKDSQSSSLLYFMQAKSSDTSDEALSYLKRCWDVHFGPIRSYPYSDHYLLLLNPDFTLDIAKEFLQHLSCTEDKAMKSALEILNMLVSACSGLLEPLYLLAKLQYLSGDCTQALSTLEKILSKVDSYVEAHLLMAQIQIQQGFHDRASQSLEACVSNDFRVREFPLYHYISGVVDKKSGSYSDAVKSLTTSLTLIGDHGNKLTLAEKASIYVELIDCLNVLEQTQDASKVLEEATKELKGTAEESRILLLSVDNFLSRKNVQGALEILQKIKPNESCYLQAQKKHADILLKYRNDKFAYLEIYKGLIGENPGAEEYVALGDAYLVILEPDDALECYQKALQMNPMDSHLILKFGRALIQTHYFTKAVKYYENQIKSSTDTALKLDLADLLMNLKEYTKAELILLDEVERENDKDDLNSIQNRIQIFNLLGHIREKSGNVKEAIKTLKSSMDNQIRLRKRLAVDQSGYSDVNVIVETALKLADLSISIKNNDDAVNFYKEGLDVSPNNIGILVNLAKLYMQMNFLELCQQTCSNILRLDSENEAASVMMADIAFHKVDFDMALFHFTQLITKQPTNWNALVRLIEILRRTGNLDDLPEYLSNAESLCENPGKDAGFLFCTALYQWYSGNLNGALKNFNATRQDSVFGLQAIYNMIEICLNPDDEMLADQFMDTEDIEYRDSRSMALKTADRLLKELKSRLEINSEDLLRHRLLTNFKLLATKDKYSIERALEDLVAIASQNTYKDDIGTILGISTAYTLLKQSQRAKNQLKRIVKSTWTFEDAEYLERCWLILADFYIQSAKFDVASDLIQKVILHNKSCTKAYEYSGFVSEKEQRYKDGVTNYENAWKYGNKSNPSVGFKLAFVLMKCKKFPAAIDVAQEVLKLSPEYPRVKKDILDKCMNNLRI
ncbi:unnamed protein product [Brassicogethes aeneus]|uniref:Tetratricopeptide repeat protein 21B n=1 Tax=Brassicogethes aeneus TaxID=1431903 RepID=A0A9P0FFK2_BRAAE|nr:unnamed protein product [Brassicogethes aeneus]